MNARVLLASTLAALAFVACASNDEKAERATSQPTSKPSMATSKPSAKRFDDIDAVSLAKLLEEDDSIVVLDIRTPEEFARGRIPGAINIDYRAPDYADKLAELDKSKTYVMH